MPPHSPLRSPCRPKEDMEWFWVGRVGEGVGVRAERVRGEVTGDRRPLWSFAHAPHAHTPQLTGPRPPPCARTASRT